MATAKTLKDTRFIAGNKKDFKATISPRYFCNHGTFICVQWKPSTFLYNAIFI